MLPIALFYGLVGGVALLLWHRFPGRATYEATIEQNADMHHYFNLLVGLLLVFRTTTSYSRYEAGVLAAGTLKTSARTLVSQAVAHSGATEDVQNLGHVGGDTTQPPPQRFIINCQRLTLLYGLMFKRHLHRQDAKPLPVLIHRGLLHDDEMRTLSDAPACCRTLVVMQWLRNVIAEAARAGLLDSPSLQLLDGTVFDSSYKRQQPIDFVLGQGQVIPGWDEGVSLLKVGDKARFVIPSDLAYGSRGAGGVIPPDAALIFDVELVAVS